MHTRLRAALAALILTLTLSATVALASGPPSWRTPHPRDASILANGPTVWPGRPLRYDGFGDQCTALAYARVNGAIVLLTADHCPVGQGEHSGDTAYTNGGVAIGTWGVFNSTWSQNDLEYIILNSTYRPTSGLNLVYKGGSPVSYLTVTRNPGSGEGCSGYVFHQAVQHDAQLNWSTTTSPVSGYYTSTSSHPGGCTIQTNVALSTGGIIDSGSPFWKTGDNTVEGVTTGNCISCGNKLYFNPIYQGLNAMNTYFANLNGTGAWLCQTSTC